MEQLKKLGVSIAIDDFATSYSSFRYLEKLPIDVAKIDRSFIRTINSNRALRLLVESAILRAHEQGLRVMGEGVETASELETLAALDCDFAQGYFFALPEPASGIRRFLTRNNS
jgi:EAL domain-containing protein (putative c-di-GMP-specific phosphodiesterase class I)